MIDMKCSQGHGHGHGQPTVGVEAQVRRAYHRHHHHHHHHHHNGNGAHQLPVNLPMNVYDSDAQYESSSSEDDNIEVSQAQKQCCGKNNDLGTNFVRNFGNLKVQETAESSKRSPVDEAVRKLTAILNASYLKTKAEIEARELIPRGPVKINVCQRPKPYQNNSSVQNLTVLPIYGGHGNGGQVLVQAQQVKYPSPNVFDTSSQDSVINDLYGALKDNKFMESLQHFSEEQWMDVMGKTKTNVLVEMSRRCPPVMPLSPDHDNLYDSSYESGSPCSSGVTSPGSPVYTHNGHGHGHRLSLSSESDPEADQGIDGCSRRPVKPRPQRAHAEVRFGERRLESLGVVLNVSHQSAVSRLAQLTESSKQNILNYHIELVKVFRKADPNEFTKDLLEIMNRKIPKRQIEVDQWQLSIYSHVQFLRSREPFFRALLARDELNRSLLYIAAVDRHEKPLIARYIAESMATIGYDPVANETDENGNSILHVLASLGDSHAHVLAELLMASHSAGPKGKVFEIDGSNKEGRTPLHTAVLTLSPHPHPYPHVTTVMLLLDNKANPFLLDKYEKSAVIYLVEQLMHAPYPHPHSHAGRQLLNRMLNKDILLTRHNQQSLCHLLTNSLVPDKIREDIQQVIITRTKDTKLKKTEKKEVLIVK